AQIFERFARPEVCVALLRRAQFETRAQASAVLEARSLGRCGVGCVVTSVIARVHLSPRCARAIQVGLKVRPDCSRRGEALRNLKLKLWTLKFLNALSGDGGRPWQR